jgi:tRNA threonylcarbamoyladenosine biosynthesis protein TsaE
MQKHKNLNLKSLQNLAFALGKKQLKRDVVIGLTGNLGSGKTTFVKSFAKAFGLRRIQSPTFVITHAYQTRNRHFYHIDFYRLHHPKELAPLGLSEMFEQPGHTVLIEWVDKFPTIKKKCDILISLQLTSPSRRDVTITQN